VSPAELRELCARESSVSVDVAAEIIGVGHTTAHDRARDTGYLDDDHLVPVRKVSARRWKVPTSALLRWADLDDEAPWGPPSPGVKTGEGEAVDLALRRSIAARHVGDRPTKPPSREEPRWSIRE
jgi:hypothetical protein